LLRNGVRKRSRSCFTELPVEVAPVAMTRKKTASAKPMIDALAGVAVPIWNRKCGGNWDAPRRSGRAGLEC